MQCWRLCFIMKVKELIDLLSKQDPEKEVMIQQGEEYDYMVAYTVKEATLCDANAPVATTVEKIRIVKW